MVGHVADLCLVEGLPNSVPRGGLNGVEEEQQQQATCHVTGVGGAVRLQGPISSSSIGTLGV